MVMLLEAPLDQFGEEFASEKFALKSAPYTQLLFLELSWVRSMIPSPEEIIESAEKSKVVSIYEMNSAKFVINYVIK